MCDVWPRKVANGKSVSPFELLKLFQPTSNLVSILGGWCRNHPPTLELKGVGYKGSANKTELTLNLGYSHPISLPTPNGIEVSVENNTLIHVKGIDKEQVGLFAQEIRSKRPPEPYKGKGVLYKGEVIIRKVGKSSK